MRFWGNLIGYQAVWFCAVIGAGHGKGEWGVVAALVFIVWQLATSRRRAVDLRLLSLALSFGLVVDGVMAARGWAIYSSPWPTSSFAPLWIIALWGAFSQTLTQSLAFLQRNAWFALAFGGIGGPLAYFSASRGFGAVDLMPPHWRGVAWLVVGWAVAICTLSQAARHWSASSEQVGACVHREPA